MFLSHLGTWVGGPVGSHSQDQPGCPRDRSVALLRGPLAQETPDPRAGSGTRFPQREPPPPGPSRAGPPFLTVTLSLGAAVAPEGWWERGLLPVPSAGGGCRPRLPEEPGSSGRLEPPPGSEVQLLLFLLPRGSPRSGALGALVTAFLPCVCLLGINDSLPFQVAGDRLSL